MEFQIWGVLKMLLFRAPQPESKFHNPTDVTEHYFTHFFRLPWEELSINRPEFFHQDRGWLEKLQFLRLKKRVQIGVLQIKQTKKSILNQTQVWFFYELEWLTCDNNVPQWWVELDNELIWLFTNWFRAFCLLCRKQPNPSQNFCYSHFLNFELSGSTLSVSKQPTQIIVQLNSSLCYIIVTFVPKKFTLLSNKSLKGILRSFTRNCDILREKWRETF